MQTDWLLHTDFNTQRLQKALKLAFKYHNHQTRKDGQPYIIHPIAVAKIVHEAGGDEDMICSALLHDAIEDYPDTKTVIKEIQTMMGTHVYFTVDALSKDAEITCGLLQQEKFFTQFKNAISQDISVFFIKFADLIHNLETIQGLKPDKREKWIQELKEGYIPILSSFYAIIPIPHRQMYHHLINRLEYSFAKISETTDL